jgi:hypothetical protein
MRRKHRAVRAVENNMSATLINLIVASTLVFGIYFWLAYGCFLALLPAFVAQLIFSFMRRPDSSESVIQWRGWWVGFYFPRK